MGKLSDRWLILYLNDELRFKKLLNSLVVTETPTHRGAQIFWRFNLGWEINENESFKDYVANCRIELYYMETILKSLSVRKFAGLCLSCLPLITFALLCTLAYLSLPLLLTDFVTQRILRLIGVLSHTKRWKTYGRADYYFFH